MVHNLNVSNPQTKAQIEVAVKQRIANANIQTYSDLNRLAASSVQIFGPEVQTDPQRKAAYLEYSKQLLQKYYDLDGDGTVSVDEFAKKEEDGAIKASELTAKHFGWEPLPEEKLVANRCGSLFAQNLDFNQNGNIDASELAFFNENADIIDGFADGQITNSGESGMFQAVVGMNAENPEYNRVVNKYLTGQMLTTEEKNILKNCQSTIRENMGKAARINIEG